LAIDERFLDELINRLNMVEVCSHYVKLEKRGNKWWGCCPFHNEKTPSFTIDPEKKLYYCFGCKEGGGLISFVEKNEKLEFPDAVAFLARMAGLEVPVDERDKAAYKRRGRLLALNKEAARFFHQNLSLEISLHARNYMAGRQISPKMISRFGLGYAPDSWNDLLNAMKQKGFSEVEVVDAGLAIRNEKGSVYDRFRNRLVFPIIDIGGNVLAFGGRVLDDSKPKYLNSPESYVYHKAHNLFALNLAKNTTQPNLILTEGYMDVLMLHQAGFDNAVASLGTALTVEQSDLIKKRTNEVILSYDSDEAGQKATERAIELLRARDIKTKILHIEGAKDPDEYIKKFGSDAFRVLINGSENSMAYRLEKIQAQYDLSKDDQKLSFLNEAIEIAYSFKNAIEIELFAGNLSELTGIRRETIQSEIQKKLRKRNLGQKKRELREESRPENMIRPASGHLHYNNLALARALEGVISLLSFNPDLLGDVKAVLTDSSTGENSLDRILSCVTNAVEQGIHPSPDLLGEQLNSDERKLLSRIQASTPDGSPKLLLRDYLSVVKREKVKMQAQNGSADDIGALIELKRKK